ncbi:hypothetical protein [Salinibacterium sp. SWN248]|uniref:hypothetical protein n=1 Tax=Salinibacterium sp. SWN248 TaxID=2792056 RepID=UPI0018CE4DCB|nr:hypothetical protein [Salinibacterium sp. SWN248]MBH0024487.1 hypothetical protein [Salinibacterium sp. SWN248]
MRKIEPDVDSYGNLIRASFFADYMELLALHREKARRESLRDLIGELFSRKKEILFDPTTTEAQPEWVVTDLADEAWTCLLQRSALLDDAYPFDVSENSLKLKNGRVVEESPYVAVLSITLAHAFASKKGNLSDSPKSTKAAKAAKAAKAPRNPQGVEYLFEEVVADAMENAGLVVGRLGPISRASSLNFVDSMNEVGRLLKVPIDANATLRRLSANDEDVDLIGLFDWKVATKGRWYFICQVTCGRSDSWRGKALEPVPDDWKAFLGEVAPPVPFLAIPHHAEDRVMKYVSSTRVQIMDRTKIVRNLTTVSAEMKAVIKSVMTAEFQSLKV